MSKQTIIYTDGACLGNPGPGGWAAIIGLPQGRVQEIGAHIEATTNNRMELLAVIEALQFLFNEFKTFGASHVILHSDSSYVIQGASKWIFGWKMRGWKNSETGEDIKNLDLWKKLDDVTARLSKLTKIDWRHIEGHAGIPGNERCDEISTTLARGERVDFYQGTTESYRFEYMAVSARKPSAPKDKTKIYYLSLVNGEIFRDATWSQCEARVKGKQGVKFRKCHSNEEEAAILKTWGFKSSK